MYGQIGHTLKAFIIIVKTPFYLLKFNKIANKKYLCNSNFVRYFY